MMIQQFTLNNVLNTFGSDLNSLTYLGAGQNGEAYKFEGLNNKTYVIKYTNRKSEVLIHKRLKDIQDIHYNGSIYEHSVRIYFIGKILSENVNSFNLYDYFIIQEYVELDELISQYWDELAFVPYAEVLDNESGEWTEQHKYYKEIFWNIEKVSNEINANDVHGENLGLSIDGIIKAFDWDDTKMNNNYMDYDGI